MTASGMQTTGRAASVLLCDAAGQVLLVRHAYGERRWSLPGGIVEHGETMAAAAVREAREEIGVQVALDSLHGSYLVHGGDRPSILAHVYRAHVLTGTPRIADAREIADLRWCEPATPPAPLTNDAREAVKDLADGVSGGNRSVVRSA